MEEYREPDRLLDAVAEALILLDPDDAESIDDLAARLRDLDDRFDATDGDHPVRQALAAVDALRAGAPAAMKDLERAVHGVRTAIERAERSPVPESQAADLAADAELVRDFAVRATEYLDDTDARLLALEADPRDREAVDAVFRAFHTIKGMAGFLGFADCGEYAHEAETLLAGARAGEPLDAATAQALFSAVDRMRGLVAVAAGETASVAPPAAKTDVPDDVAGVLGMDEDVAVSAAPSADRPLSSSSAAGTAAPARNGSVRVDEERLDALVDAIGELVIAETMASAVVRTGADAAALSMQLDRLDKITRELQQMATSLRMVPLRATFARMARLVRDLARQEGKLIDFVMTGEDAELDKEVVDRIHDPLVHALRNAVDHGIETPAERRAAGKPETARIELRAYHAGGAVHVDVTDDGRGLDADRIVATARRKGLLGEDERPDDRAVYDILFHPGFSTAETVTEVSGRGVGMDVVRRVVDELRGRVELKSRPGEGTTLSVRLPVTLAIIDGMSVRVGDERYIVPMLTIDRTVRPVPGQLTTVAGRGEMLRLEDGMLPVVRLHRLFSVQDAEEDPTHAVVIVTSDDGHRAGLLACELLGQQQTVIKPLGDGLPDQPGVAGGAIMPDGRVGLILDTAGLVQSARMRGGE